MEKKRLGVQPTFHITRFFLAFFIRTFWRKWENSFGKVGKKVCPVGCCSLVLINWDSPQGRPFFPTFPMEFSHFLQTQGSHSRVLLENKKKNLEFQFGVRRHASFPQKPVVKFGVGFKTTGKFNSFIFLTNYQITQNILRLFNSMIRFNLIFYFAGDMLEMILSRKLDWLSERITRFLVMQIFAVLTIFWHFSMIFGYKK